MRQIFLVLGLAFLLTACQKEVGFDTPIDPGTNPGSNPNSSANTYSPLTTGTWWVYQDSTSLDTIKQTVIAVTRTNNGITYKAVIADNPAMDTAFHAKSGSKYFQWTEGATQSGGAASIVLNYLDESLAQGDSSNFSGGTGNGFTATGKIKTVQKNFSMTLLGKNYTNVIHSVVTMSYTMAGMTIDMGTYHFYVAKGVGIIKARSELTMLGQTVILGTLELKNHQVM